MNLVFIVLLANNWMLSTAPQVTGLYVINDMFPFHVQARKVTSDSFLAINWF